MEKITLLIIDCQCDFIDGSMTIKDASKAMWKINDLLKSGIVEHAVFTVDWHPVNHCSFKQNGGIWPTHCVNYSKGASISPILFNYCIISEIKTSVIRKGAFNSVEEYGIEGDTDFLHSNSNGAFINPKLPIVICGIAGDYCVLESLKGIQDLHPSVYVQGTVSIDDGTKLLSYVESNNIPIFTL